VTGCPCGFGEPYPACCGRYHRGDVEPPTAEALMRARYSAFVLGVADFLVDTWHPSTRPTGPVCDPALTWTGLFVTDRTGGGLLDRTGTVAFTARYRQADGTAGQLRENSRFVRDGGSWRYLGPT
jgi:SEC-C motif domain protein